MAKRQADKAQKALQPSIDAQTGIAQTFQQQGTQLIGEGQDQLRAPTNFYQQLLSGNKAAVSQAVAPDVANLRDVYSGAHKQLERSGTQGASRDMASAELGRQEAGQLGSFVLGARPAAAEAMTAMGQNTRAAGVGMGMNAANIYGSLLTGARQDRAYNGAISQQIGENTGELLTSIYKAWGSKQGQKNPLPPGEVIRF
jgi:hypothetical protein